MHPSAYVVAGACAAGGMATSPRIPLPAPPRLRPRLASSMRRRRFLPPRAPTSGSIRFRRHVRENRPRRPRALRRTPRPRRRPRRRPPRARRPRQPIDGIRGMVRSHAKQLLWGIAAAARHLAITCSASSTLLAPSRPPLGHRRAALHRFTLWAIVRAVVAEGLLIGLVACLSASVSDSSRLVRRRLSQYSASSPHASRASSSSGAPSCRARRRLLLCALAAMVPPSPSAAPNPPRTSSKAAARSDRPAALNRPARTVAVYHRYPHLQRRPAPLKSGADRRAKGFPDFRIVARASAPRSLRNGCRPVGAMPAVRPARVHHTSKRCRSVRPADRRGTGLDLFPR
jgi:hypothetical protein